MASRPLGVGTPPGRAGSANAGGLGLPTVQDALLGTLRQERAAREETEGLLRQAQRDCGVLQLQLDEARAREDREQDLQDELESRDERIHRANAEKDAAVQVCNTLRDDAARVTERALERTRRADDVEGGMQLQILALKERLVSSQTASAKDRAELLQSIHDLSAAVKERDSEILSLKRQLAEQHVAHEDATRQQAEDLTRQSDPYRQLNAVLMASLASAKQDAERHKTLARAVEAENAELKAEVKRLKDAQNILTGPYRARLAGGGTGGAHGGSGGGLAGVDGVDASAMPGAPLQLRTVTPERCASPLARSARAVGGGARGGGPGIPDQEALLLHSMAALHARSGWRAGRADAAAPHHYRGGGLDSPARPPSRESDPADLAGVDHDHFVDIDDTTAPPDLTTAVFPPDAPHEPHADQAAPAPTAPPHSQDARGGSRSCDYASLPADDHIPAAPPAHALSARSTSPMRRTIAGQGLLLQQPRQSSPPVVSGGPLLPHHSSVVAARWASPSPSTSLAASTLREPSSVPTLPTHVLPADEFQDLSPGPLPLQMPVGGGVDHIAMPPAAAAHAGAEPEPGSQEHAEALDALKSSLADVRGLLARRAKRRHSGSTGADSLSQPSTLGQ